MPALVESPREAAVAPHRFTVEQYHRMIETGILTEESRVELLDGQILPKMPQNPPHRRTILRLRNALQKRVPPAWEVATEAPITLFTSEPEPDLSVSLYEGDLDDHHPGPRECGLVVEIADSSLARDRTLKLRIYARDKVPVYWIVNLAERCVEVYEVPNGTRAKPRYKVCLVYTEHESVPVFLKGQKAGEIAVAEILPAKA